MPYTDAQKREVVDFVDKYNADHARGGQMEAAKKYGVSPLAIAAWLKKRPASSSALSIPEITTERPKDPAWDNVRLTYARVQAAGREYLYGKAWLGWQLFILKKSHGVRRGGDQKSNGQAVRSISWADIVKDELDLHERTANRLIEKFEAVKAKAKRTLKKLPGGENALTIFQSENPLALPPEQRQAMLDVITSLCDGETEGSLMMELKIIPEPPPMPAATKKKAAVAKYSNEQLAFDFFEGPASAICKARASAEYKKLLYMLPPTTDEEGKVSLVFMRDEISAMLEDVNEALAAHAKPAKPAKSKA